MNNHEFCRRLTVLLVLSTTAVAPALAVTIHVPGNQPTIQQGIDAAQPGDVVLIDPGTYTGPLNRDLNFHGKAILVQGAGAATVIDCESLGRGFIFQSAEGAGSTLRDLVVTRGGNLNLGSGGGIQCVNGSSPTIQGCTLSFNTAVNGAGMYLNASSPSITDCAINDNGPFDVAIFGAGIACVNGASPTITRCTFERNFACCASSGGAIGCRDGSPSITDCDFAHNGAERGGAIFCFGVSAPVIVRCTFASNDGEFSSAIGAELGASPLVSGCLFCDNTAQGAAIMCADASITIRSSTIVTSHYFIGTPSVIFATRAHVTLEKTIIALNDATSVVCMDNSTVTLTCCDIFGNTGGDWVGCIAAQQGQAGNFGADPLFCDLSACDGRLRSGSPCLPGNHPQGAPCGLIGASGLSCGPTAVAPASWGNIKAVFRP